MDRPSPAMRQLARRLLAAESANQPTQSHAAAVVCDKLRLGLTRLVGPDGFAALLRRALVLARQEAPALADARVKADGTLEGLPAAADEERGAADAALAAQLLSLVVTFVGESITRQLIDQIWPGVAWESRPPAP